MTIEQIWQNVAGPVGGLFLLAVAVWLLFNGRLVNGDVARQARLDALNELRQRYDEMQATWKTRYEDMRSERDYYRTIALQFARQAEQGIALAKDKLPIP